MFGSPEKTIVISDEAETAETRTTLKTAAETETIFSAVGTIKRNHQWKVIHEKLSAIIEELDLLENYFMKAAHNVNIGRFKTSERQKLLNLYKELNKLASVLSVGYCCQKLASREDFEDELKNFKDEFEFVLRTLPPTSITFSGDPEIIFDQLTTTATIVEDVKRILTAYFLEQFCWRDILEQFIAILLYVCDILSDWIAALRHFESYFVASRYVDLFSPLINSMLTLIFIHLAAFRTSCTYVNSKLLIPLFTILPVLPIHVMSRQLYTCFKFKRKPDDIHFKEMIRFHSVREDLVYIYSAAVLPNALPQLILQGCIILNILLSLPTESPLWKWLMFAWATSLLNLSYACAKRSLFEFTNSSRFVSIPYFVFFLFYKFSRCVSWMLLFVVTPWWLGVTACFMRFTMSLVWLCRKIQLSYNIRFSVIRKIVSSWKGSLMLTSIPMLCHWSEFPQFWMNALDVFACLTLSVVWAHSLIGEHFIEAVSLVISVIIAWFVACIVAWNSPSLSRVFFAYTFDDD